MVKLQLLLNKGHRDDNAKRAVQRILAGLHIRVTAVGAATISAEIEQADFEQLFGKPAEAAQQPDTPALPLPDSMRDCVVSITVAPEFIPMAPPRGGGQ